MLKTNSDLILKLTELSLKCEEQNIFLKKVNKKEEVFASENYKSKRKYKKKCKQLQEKIERLEQFQRLTVNREIKMIELKEKLKRLLNKE